MAYGGFVDWFLEEAEGNVCASCNANDKIGKLSLQIKGLQSRTVKLLAELVWFEQQVQQLKEENEQLKRRDFK